MKYKYTVFTLFSLNNSILIGLSILLPFKVYSVFWAFETEIWAYLALMIVLFFFLVLSDSEK